MAIAAAGAAILGPVIGGLIGQQQSAAARAQAQAAAQAALAEINAVGAPPDQSGAILLKHFQSAGLYTPGLENQINAGIAQASQTNTDTQGRQAQVGALGQMQQAANTGYTAVDRAALNNIMQQAGAANQGMQQSAIQSAASRGQAGSGAQLAAQLQGASSAGNSAANQSLQQAAQAQQARMAALGQVGSMGSNLSAADFAQAQAKATAADRFKQFDVTNQIAQQQRNVGAGNQGQLYNLSNNQQISSANTQLDNAEKARQLAATQQNWQEQLQLAQSKANANIGAAQTLNNQANATAGQYAGIGAGVGSGAGAALGYMGKQAKATNPTDPMAGYPGTNDPGMGQQPAANDVSTMNAYNGGMIHGYSNGGEVPNHHLSDEQLHAKVKRMMALKKLQELCDGGPVQNYDTGGKVKENSLYQTKGYNQPNPGADFLTQQPMDMSVPDVPIQSNQAAIDAMHAKIVNDAAAYRAAHPEEYNMGGSVNMADQMMGGNLAYGSESPITALLKTKGGPVPGKAKVKGDSPKNDTVQTRLSPGELVLPRTVVEKGPDAAYGFVHAITKHKDDKK